MVKAEVESRRRGCSAHYEEPIAHIFSTDFSIRPNREWLGLKLGVACSTSRLIQVLAWIHC